MIEERLFNNRYRLDSKLGEGGMAVVYSGTDTLLRRKVAIKVLREQYAVDDEFVRRFYQEAESAAKLSHPNIVNTYDVGSQGNVYYIVMEFVDGPSLAELIATDGKLPESVAIDYATQICNGLAYAHRQGLLHRDIKPANILVTKDDVVKLSDFGIARAVSAQTMALTRPGLVMGSAYYMSPEQAQNHEIHETSDLYAVGVVLYQTLTGKVPYTGESPVTVALKHIGDPVPTLDGEAPGTSPALSAIVNKLLQKNPKNRFQSATDVAKALRAARERPAHAAYSMQDDAPVGFGSQPLPPRRSPLPDRPFTSISEDEDRTSRSLGRMLWAALAVLIVAIATGYFIFGHQLPGMTPTVKLASYKNMSLADAEQALENAGLAVKHDYRPDNKIPRDHVIDQNPAANSSVPAGSTVELIVSNGLPVIGLPDYTTFSWNDAKKLLESQQFRVKVFRRNDPAPKDTVIAESPKPRTQVPQGTTVVLTVSDGPAMKYIPDLTNRTVDQASKLARDQGFALDTTQTQPSDQMPAGRIISQDVAYGTEIDPSKPPPLVHAIVSTGSASAANENGAGAGPNAAVPDVRNHSFTDAAKTLEAAGFQYSITYNVRDVGDRPFVQDEDPLPSSEAPQGSQIRLMLAVPGAVPDIDGYSLTDATNRLLDFGYQISDTQTQNISTGGRVMGTRPDAGTTLAPGSKVIILVGKP